MQQASCANLYTAAPSQGQGTTQPAAQVIHDASSNHMLHIGLNCRNKEAGGTGT